MHPRDVSSRRDIYVYTRRKEEWPVRFAGKDSRTVPKSWIDRIPSFYSPIDMTARIRNIEGKSNCQKSDGPGEDAAPWHQSNLNYSVPKSSRRHPTYLCRLKRMDQLLKYDELTLTLAISAVALFLGNRILQPTSMAHPMLLGRQVDVAPVRRKGETAIYRNFGVGNGAPVGIWCRGGCWVKVEVDDFEIVANETPEQAMHRLGFHAGRSDTDEDVMDCRGSFL